MYRVQMITCDIGAFQNDFNTLEKAIETARSLAGGGEAL